MPKVAIIGATSWGTTLGVVLARREVQVSLWVRTRKEAVRLRKTGPNSAVLSGIIFPPQLTITSSISEAFADAEAVILALAVQTTRTKHKAGCRPP